MLYFFQKKTYNNKRQCVVHGLWWRDPRGCVNRANQKNSLFRNLFIFFYSRNSWDLFFFFILLVEKKKKSLKECLYQNYNWIICIKSIKPYPNKLLIVKWVLLIDTMSGFKLTSSARREFKSKKLLFNKKFWRIIILF